MKRPRTSRLTLLFSTLAAAALTGCSPTEAVKMPSISIGFDRDPMAAPVKAEAVRRFLAKADLDRSQIVSAATASIRRGEVYNTRERDKHGRWQHIAVWVDAEEPGVLRVYKKGVITCPACNGSGVRQTSFKLPKSIEIQCRDCKGTGEIEDRVRLRYVLARSDYKEGARIPAPLQPAEARLSREEEQYIRQAVEDDPTRRLQALEWLNVHYIRRGEFFHRFQPLLRKARWIETDPERGVTVYQFWAGKSAHPAKAYFRVWVDAESGRIERTNFVSANEMRQAGPEKESTVDKTMHSVRDWFRWREVD